MVETARCRYPFGMEMRPEGAVAEQDPAGIEERDTDPLAQMGPLRNPDDCVLACADCSCRTLLAARRTDGCESDTGHTDAT